MSSLSSGMRTAETDSLFVRTSSPSRSLISRQRAAVLALRQQAIGAQRAGGEDDAARRVRAPLLAQPGAGPLGGDPVAVAAVGGAERNDVDHFVLGHDLRAFLLGEPQVVLEQRVLGADAAADQAGAAPRAAGARRACAAEHRVGNLLAGLAEVDADRGAGERVGDAEMSRHLLRQLLPGAFERHRVDAQHPLGGGVMRLQLFGPIVQIRPLRVAEERVTRPVQRGGVDHAAAAHGGPLRMKVSLNAVRRMMPRSPSAGAQRKRRRFQVVLASPRPGSGARTPARRPCSLFRSVAAPKRCRRSLSR